MDLYGNDGRIYTITNKIANRDTGDFYEVDGHLELIAKIIYDDKRNRGRWAKVDEFTKTNSLESTFLKQIALPKVALYDSCDQNHKSFHGYLMERLLGFVPLNQIINDGNFNYHKVVWIAKNLCVLTAAMHRHKYIIGDFNPNKILLNPKTGRVVISELDEIQFSVNRDDKIRLCPCTIGVSELLAPEIHKRLIEERANLETVWQTPTNPLFTEYTDRYSLAYHLFFLLMGGCSPFAGMIDIDELAMHKSKTVSDIEVDELKAVRNGEFLFSKKLTFKKPPAYAPKFRILTKQLRILFERAFIDGASDPTARPNETEFYFALEEYMETLRIKCKKGHYMPKYFIGKCEWCRVKKEKDKINY